MSSNIEILMSGYARTEGDNKIMRACGSCCLVRSNGKNIIFDTMGPWEKDLLIEKLASFKIHPNDLNFVVCSHSHPDHIGNINLFLNAEQQIIGTSVFKEDSYNLTCFEPKGSVVTKTDKGDEKERIVYEPIKIDSNILVEPTPGHTMECVSMIIENCNTYGTVGLVGDLFEREEDISNESIWISAGSQQSDLQRMYRKYVYDKVDFILPGHGPIFKATH